MQVRHRIPTIFNLSMVDVLCCALGCVILLWLINMREFKQRAVAAAETGKRLLATQASLDETARAAADTRRRLASVEEQARSTASMLADVRTERDQVALRAEALQKDRDQTRRDLDAARMRAEALNKDALALKAQTVADEERLADLKALNTAADERVARLSREQKDLAKEKRDAAQRAAALEKLLRDKETAATAAGRQADELAERLRDAEARLKQLRTAADSKLTTTEQRVQALETDINAHKKELADAQRSIVVLEGEKKQLADRALRAQAAVENRFAGMTLTGRRVVFLVDMSGSMELVDERTPAPDKWTAVRETLAKIMRSLQDLDQFQVILFSDRVEYPLRGESDWLAFDPKTSVERVSAALAAVKPRGNTNVYAGLQAAFRFRQAGMDTLYFISDGLPNIGEGLPAQGTRSLRETERSDILSRHVRGLLKSDWNRDIPGRRGLSLGPGA
jgi:predicted  nucleic acid-binding Zn-ribbon protein